MTKSKINNIHKKYLVNKLLKVQVTFHCNVCRVCGPMQNIEKLFF